MCTFWMVPYASFRMGINTMKPFEFTTTTGTTSPPPIFCHVSWPVPVSAAGWKTLGWAMAPLQLNSSEKAKCAPVHSDSPAAVQTHCCCRERVEHMSQPHRTPPCGCDGSVATSVVRPQVLERSGTLINPILGCSARCQGHHTP